MPRKSLGKIIESHPTGFPDVCIIKFENRPFFYIRIYHAKKYYYRTTETVDVGRALKVVPEIFTTFLQNPTSNEKNESHSVSFLIDKFVAHHELRVKRGEITERTWEAKHNSLRSGMLAYLIEFSLLRVNELNFKKDFEKYASWRKAQGYKHSTIKLEVKIIKEFATWLHTNGFIKNATCNIPVPRQTHEAREEEENERAFTEEQVVLIRTEFEKQIENSTGSEKGRWIQVHHYFELMLEGGFRTSELFHVEWRDIQMKDNGECLMDVRVSKTGQRDTIFISKVVPLIKEFQKSKKVPITKETSLWTNPGTHKMWSKQFFSTRFRKILNAVGLGLEYRLYCCRATHITRRIAKGVRTYLLAKNLGTSEYMIAKHYEDVILAEETKSLLLHDEKPDLVIQKAEKQVFVPLV